MECQTTVESDYIYLISNSLRHGTTEVPCNLIKTKQLIQMQYAIIRYTAYFAKPKTHNFAQGAYNYAIDNRFDFQYGMPSRTNFKQYSMNIWVY